jgi:hypothetical protein
MNLLINVEKEIIQLHHFFQDWFNGDLSPTDRSFSRLIDALDPEFKMVTPRGTILERGELLENLRTAHYSHREMRIWIENVMVHSQVGDIFIVTYEEWQEIKGRITSRFSSAIFKTCPSAPNGVCWIHLHETWINSIQGAST